MTSRALALPLVLATICALGALAGAAASAGPGKPAAKGLRLSATIKVPGWPSAPAVTPGAIWVPTTLHSGLVRIDTRTNRKTTIIAGSTTGAQRADHFDTALAAFGSVWAASDYGQALRRVDPASGKVTATMALPSRPCQLAAAGGSLWVCAAFTGNVLRVDPAQLAVTATVDIGVGGRGNSAGVTGSDADGVWALDAGGPSAVRIDPASATVTKRVSILTRFAPAPGYLPALWGAQGAGSIWALNQLRNALVRIDPKTAKVVAAVRMPLGENPFGIAVGGGSVWVVDDSYVIRIDPGTNRVSGWARFPRAARSAFNGVAWADGSAWVTNLDRDAVYRITPTR